MPEVRILIGDVREKLAELPDESVHCVVTSPPYFGLRDYGVAGQIGLEPTPAEFVAVMVEVFREVRRVLRKDGTLWLNLGDSYAAGKAGRADTDSVLREGRTSAGPVIQRSAPAGFKQKDLIGIPWRVAFALQADGWYLRQDIIWSKPNPMPESVTDRCTKAHEYLFLLSKSARYHYDAEAIAEPSLADPGQPRHQEMNGHSSPQLSGRGGFVTETRNRRSVWTVATQPFKEAHFATFPPDLIEPCIKAGCPKDCCAKCGAPVVREIEQGELLSRSENDGKGYVLPKATASRVDADVKGGRQGKDTGFLPNHRREKETIGWSPSCTCDAGLARGTVLDPFGGAGTTGLVADRLQRDAILIELNPAYAAMARERIHGDSPLFSDVALLQAAE